MAKLLQPFNAQQFDPTQAGSFEQLPIGKHPVKIVASEIKPTADNTGGYVQFDLEVIGGPDQGKRGPMRLNLYNQSEKAKAIAESQMAALCYVTGVFLVDETAALHNIPFAVEVTAQTLTPQQVERQQRGEQVTPFTQVHKILDINGNEPKANGQAAAPVAAPAPAQAGGWGQGAPAPAAAPVAPAGGPAWGGAPAAAAPAPAPVAAPAAAGWAQAPAAGGAPAWGKPR